MASVCVRDRSTVHNFTNLNYRTAGLEKKTKHTHGIKKQSQHPFRASSPGGFPVAAATRVRESGGRLEGDRPISTCYVVYHEARADTLAIHDHVRLLLYGIMLPQRPSTATVHLTSIAARKKDATRWNHMCLRLTR